MIRARSITINDKCVRCARWKRILSFCDCHRIPPRPFVIGEVKVKVRLTDSPDWKRFVESVNKHIEDITFSSRKERGMKKKGLTLKEAAEHGGEIRRAGWLKNEYIRLNPLTDLYYDARGSRYTFNRQNMMATDWEIYEPKPEPVEFEDSVSEHPLISALPFVSNMKLHSFKGHRVRVKVEVLDE